MKLLRTVIASAAVLALCSCGSGDPETATSETTPRVAAPENSELKEEASALYDEYAQELRDLGVECGSYETSLVTSCLIQLARAKDILDDVEARLLSVEPELDEAAPELDEALEDTFEFYEDWSVTPAGQNACSRVFDINSPLFSAPEVGRCTSAAASMSGFLPYIAERLAVVAET